VVWWIVALSWLFSGEGSNSVPKRKFSDLRKEEEAEKTKKEMRKPCLIGEEKRNPLLVETVVKELETKGTLPGKHCPGLFPDLTQKEQRPSKLSLGPSQIPLSPAIISKSELDALNDAVKQVCAVAVKADDAKVPTHLLDQRALCAPCQMRGRSRLLLCCAAGAC
jgi:hypothetical protein